MVHLLACVVGSKMEKTWKSRLLLICRFYMIIYIKCNPRNMRQSYTSLVDSPWVPGIVTNTSFSGVNLQLSSNDVDGNDISFDVVVM